MARRTCPPPAPARLAGPQLLDSLAAALVAPSRSTGADRPALVRARPTADGVDLALAPVAPGHHPVDHLVGTVLPATWTISGVLVVGTAHGPSAPPTPVRVGALVDRSGHTATLTLPSRDGPAAPVASGPAEGRLVDALRRTLRLPTPAPPRPPGAWWAAWWLDRVVAEVAVSPESPRTLRELAGMHPLVEPTRAGGPVTAADVMDLHRIPLAEDVGGWERIRRVLAGRDAPASGPERQVRAAVGPLVPAEAAAWFDAGSLARWLEAELPPLAVLLAGIDALLSPRLARALRRAVAGALPEAIPATGP